MVDDEYYRDNMEFNGIPVHKVSSMDFKVDFYNIILGVMPFNRRIQEITDYVKRKAKNCKIYCFELTREYFNLENIDRQYIIDNHLRFEETHDYLEDELSKKSFIAYLNESISRDVRYLDECFTMDEYFPGIFKFNQEEIFIDCGAYDGDTITKFIEHMEKIKCNYKKIVAFEPDNKNFEQLYKKYQKDERCRLIQQGVYSDKKTLRFRNTESKGSSLNKDGDTLIEVESIDNVLNGDTATYIKMDIEGAELAALKGAEKTIIKCKPKLAICVYHKKTRFN